MKEDRTHLRGFASMDPEKRHKIAVLGGQAVHEQGKAITWTGGKNGTASNAGRKGQRIMRENKAKQAESKLTAETSSLDAI